MRALSSFIIMAVLVLVVCLPGHGQEEKGRGYYDLGVFAYEDGDFITAETNLKKALDLEPDKPFYHQYLGKTYLAMEQYEKARLSLTRAWDLDPELSGIKFDLGTLYYKLKDYSEAAKFFLEVTEEEPDNVLANYLGGISLYKQGQYKKALDLFLVSSDKSPTVKTNGYFYAGICYIQLGDFNRAKEHLEYARDNAKTENLRESSIEWLASIKDMKEDLKPWGLTFRAGYISDDNFLREPSYGNIYTDEADNYFGLYFNGYFNLINKNPFKLGIGYEHLETMHDDLDEYDMRVMIPKAYLEYLYSSFRFSINYFLYKSLIDSNDYLRQHRIRPWK